jgi:hypothetical protein
MASPYDNRASQTVTISFVAGTNAAMATVISFPQLLTVNRQGAACGDN